MRTLIWDLAAFAGVALVVAGLAIIYAPLIWLFAGGCLFALGVWGAWRSR